MKKVITKKIVKKKFLFKLWPLFLVVPLLGIFFYFFIYKALPSPSKLSNTESKQSTLVYDRNGKLLYNIHTEKDAIFVPLNTIPKQVQEATIAIEDRNFYKHGAVDLRGITRAAYSIAFKKEMQGGSTLTQQLVKTTLLSPERTITRKLKEITLAFATELLYSKKQILEMYLNQVPYGGTAYGVEAAAQTYFGKHAKDLDLAESALLAGLPEAPTTFSPYGAHPELAKKRQKQVLEAMVEEGYITKQQKDKALKKELKYKPMGKTIKAPHFVLFVKDFLTKKYGAKMVEEGGLRVTTSLDLTLQEYAQATVAGEVEKLKGSNVSNGAAMISNPATGEILAMVGSKGYFDESIDGNVNITVSQRQPGSSIKPINYAVGLLKGYTAATPFIDNKICFPNQGGKAYCPMNYDGKFHGVVTMRNSLGSSLNIPAVKMLKINGLEAMIATASAMGITTYKNADNYGLSLTLGGGEVMMYDMIQAFGVFANGGYRVNLQPILRVTDRFGKVVEQYNPPKSPIFGKKILPEGVAFIISDILADNNARLMAFGANSELRIPGKTVSVKTGTTNDYRDNWTIGYTPSYVVATWVGNNDNSVMRGVVSGVTGAAPIWHDLMSHLLENKPDQPMQKPVTIVQKPVCGYTGAPAPDGKTACNGAREYFIRGKEIVKYGFYNEKVWVDKNTQNPVVSGTPTDNLELKDAQMISDPTGDRYCLSCPHPTEPPKPTPQR